MCSDNGVESGSTSEDIHTGRVLIPAGFVWTAVHGTAVGGASPGTSTSASSQAGWSAWWALPWPRLMVGLLGTGRFGSTWATWRTFRRSGAGRSRTSSQSRISGIASRQVVGRGAPAKLRWTATSRRTGPCGQGQPDRRAHLGRAILYLPTLLGDARFADLAQAGRRMQVPPDQREGLGHPRLLPGHAHASLRFGTMSVVPGCFELEAAAVRFIGIGWISAAVASWSTSVFGRCGIRTMRLTH